VLVANRPRLIRELVVETLHEQAGVEVVGEVADEVDIEQAVARVEPEFLIIALGKSDERPSLCDLLLARHPAMKILALAPERNSGVCYWGSPDIQSARIECSEKGILDALRGPHCNET